jgi:hypothetical protein
LRATCDNLLEVYLNGENQHDGALGDWLKVSTFETSEILRVVALKCTDSGGKYGIIASLHNTQGEVELKTDTTWKCSSVYVEGWERPDFEDTSCDWNYAEKIKDHGDGPWQKKGQIRQISDEADWIWAEGTFTKIAYCRGQVKGISLTTRLL